MTTDNKTLPSSEGATPLMAQYLEVKSRHLDCLLFFRMGDFYELLYHDAVIGSSALDIALTKRGKHQDKDIPMCGVPAHACEVYIERLIRKGHKVAICDQVEDASEAKKRAGKTLVKRDVVRIVTAGTLTEETMLDSRSNHYLTAVSFPNSVKNASSLCGVAWLEMSTGEFYVTSCAFSDLFDVLSRLSPQELVFAEPHYEMVYNQFLIHKKLILSPLPSQRFRDQDALRQLLRLYDIKTMDVYGQFEEAEMQAAGALIHYVELTQKGKLPFIRPLISQKKGVCLQIDAATTRNLELMQTLSGEYKGSLLSCFAKTITGAGSRLLRTWLSMPLLEIDQITHRQDAVSWGIERDEQRSFIIEQLKKTGDISRAIGRLSLGRGSPRDLALIKNTLHTVKDLSQGLQGNFELPFLLSQIKESFEQPFSCLSLLDQALEDEGLPLLARDGGFIRAGYDAQLDEFQELRDNSKKVIHDMEGAYKEQTGITSLKIKHNHIIGLHIEVTATYAERLLKAPLSEIFFHRQTMASAMRFSTTVLVEIEQKLSQAGQQAIARELTIFEQIVQSILKETQELTRLASSLAMLDALVTLSQTALEQSWTRPQFIHYEETGQSIFEMNRGRHPVVEQSLKENNGGVFIPNDCHFAENLETNKKLWLITGPNMGGKSTFLRQTALNIILAQVGSFVPADSLKLTPFDRIFSRVGAGDDLARGHSTFMVEMMETSTILNQATPRSFVILDELGRGTSTYDGLSLAWACAEALVEKNKCLSLFATHYHELPSLEKDYPEIGCLTVLVEEKQGKIIFLHEMIQGKASHSYGLHVAKLAGLPDTVLKRANGLLKSWETQTKRTESGALSTLPLFQGIDFTPTPASQSENKTKEIQQVVPEWVQDLKKLLEETDPDTLTPRQALEQLYALKKAYQK